MASPSYARSLTTSLKRLRLTPPSPIVDRQIRPLSQSIPNGSSQTQTRPQQEGAKAAAERTPHDLSSIRLPKAVQATYLNPLRRAITHDIPVCDLQLRSYSVRNVELFADFALRAAYFLKLPAKGPVPLRRITERWTVPRSNFVHKKSQENFERVTLRRWIRVVDAHPESVALWLAFLRQHAYYGVGMKASVYERGGLDVAADLDREQEAIAERLGEKFALVGGSKKALLATQPGVAESALLDEPFKAAWGAAAPMGGTPSAPHVNEKIEAVRVAPRRAAGRRAS